MRCCTSGWRSCPTRSHPRTRPPGRCPTRRIAGSCRPRRRSGPAAPVPPSPAGRQCCCGSRTPTRPAAAAASVGSGWSTSRAHRADPGLEGLLVGLRLAHQSSRRVFYPTTGNNAVRTASSGCATAASASRNRIASLARTRRRSSVSSRSTRRSARALIRWISPINSSTSASETGARGPRCGRGSTQVAERCRRRRRGHRPPGRRPSRDGYAGGSRRAGAVLACRGGDVTAEAAQRPEACRADGADRHSEVACHFGIAAAGAVVESVDERAGSSW
jgi:hypothetical protein